MTHFRIIFILFGTLLVLTPVHAATTSSSETGEALVKAQQKRLEAVAGYEQARQRLNAAKAQFTQQSTTAAAKAVEEETRRFLMSTTAAMISHLTNVQTKVDEAQGLKDDERAALRAQLDDDAAWMQGVQASLAAMPTAQFKQTARDLRDRWKQTRVDLKRVLGELQVAHSSLVMDKLQAVVPEMETALAKLDTAGFLMEEASRQLNEYKVLIGALTSQRDSVRGRFRALGDLASADRQYNEAMKELRQLNRAIREAHAKLNSLLKTMRQAQKKA